MMCIIVALREGPSLFWIDLEVSNELFNKRCVKGLAREFHPGCVQLLYAITTITLGKLAKVLGVPPGELIEEVSNDQE